MSNEVLQWCEAVVSCENNGVSVLLRITRSANYYTMITVQVIDLAEGPKCIARHARYQTRRNPFSKSFRRLMFIVRRSSDVVYIDGRSLTGWRSADGQWPIASRLSTVVRLLSRSWQNGLLFECKCATCYHVNFETNAHNICRLLYR